MRLRRRLDSLLSEGRGMQLLWLALVLIASFFVFWWISEFIFKDSVFQWQDIVALYLDPGVFGGAGRHDFFRLSITIFGAFFFAAMLISVVSNIFENIRESYKKGEPRYSFHNHILILGANQLLLGMLAKLREKIQRDPDCKKLQIIIMTTQSIENLRDRIETYFGDKRFMRHITLYYDERDQLSNLEDADADKDDSIFIIGEEGEDNHDAVNLKSLQAIKEICRESSFVKKHKEHVISCWGVMESQTTMGINYYSKDSDNDDLHRLHVDIVNANEYEAEQILTNKDFSCIDRSLDQEGKVILGIRPESEHVNFLYNQKGYQSRKYDSAEEAWYIKDCYEWSKLSSIYCGIATDNKARSFPASLDKKLTDNEIDILCELEHRRWTMVELLLGYSAPSKTEKKNLIKLRQTDKYLYGQVFV